MSYPVYSYGKNGNDKEILLRQADVGWEYYDHEHSHWRKANNCEQALQFALEDLSSRGKAHHWRYDNKKQPMAPEWHPVVSEQLKNLPEPNLWIVPRSSKPKSRFDQLRDFLKTVPKLRIKLVTSSDGSTNDIQTGEPKL